MTASASPRLLIKSPGDIQTLLDEGLNPETRIKLIERDLKAYEPILKALAKTTNVPGAPEGNVEAGVSRLKDIFRAQAERTGSYLSYEFKIASMLDIILSAPAGKGKFFYAIIPSVHVTQMGFLQESSTRHDHKYSLPFVGFAEDMLATLKTFNSDALLIALEDLFTYTNHDPLHHITSDVLNPVVSRKGRNAKPGEITKFIDNFEEEYQGSVDDQYENFMLRSQATLFHIACKEDPEYKAGYFATLDRFFDELSRIHDDMISNENTIEASSLDSHRAHCLDTLTCVGEAALYSTMRLYPVKSDETTPYFKRLQDILSRGKPLTQDEIDEKTLSRMDNFLNLHGTLARHIEAVYYDSSFATLNQDKTLRQKMVDAVAHDTMESLRDREAQIEYYRATFEKFEACGKHFHNPMVEIKEGLWDLGLDIETLDRKGTATRQDILDRISAAVRNHHLAQAIKILHELETIDTLESPHGIEVMVGNVGTYLEKAEAPLASLDKTGKSSDAQMSERLLLAQKHAHLFCARTKFYSLEDDVKDPAVTDYDLGWKISDLLQHLGWANERWTALDELGASTEADINSRFEQIAEMKRAHLKFSAKDDRQSAAFSMG